ncbi:MAG: sulfatase-like hydrolase/transferase [Isosphaeraceae bacterium]
MRRRCVGFTITILIAAACNPGFGRAPEPAAQVSRRPNFVFFLADDLGWRDIETMDRSLGRILDALDRLGLSDDTIVFFMSDNGGVSTAEGAPTCNLPLRAGKGWLYEGGIREPMIVKWPGVTRPGSTSSTPVISTDFYPTMLEMAGLPAKPEQHVDGVSMVPLLGQTGSAAQRVTIGWAATAIGAAEATKPRLNPKLTAIPENTWEKVAGFAPAPSGILAYWGGVYDPVNHQFLIFGGGHADYWGNEVCAFSPATLTWKRMYEPDAQARYTSGNIDNVKGKLKDSDKPYTRHTYNQLCFVTNSASMFIFGGAGPGWGNNVVLLVVDSGVWAYKPPQQFSASREQR